MTKADTVKDPVCKMELKRSDAEATAEYNGRTLYFCTEQCKETFEKNPENYINKQRVA